MHVFCRRTTRHSFELYFWHLRMRITIPPSFVTPTCSFVIRISENLGFLVRVVLLVFLASMPAIALAQPPLHIRVINAKTNQPVTDERLNVALRVDQGGSAAQGATEK